VGAETELVTELVASHPLQRDRRDAATSRSESPPSAGWDQPHRVDPPGLYPGNRTCIPATAPGSVGWPMTGWCSASGRSSPQEFQQGYSQQQAAADAGA
jgi:hypothetical protein